MNKPCSGSCKQLKELTEFHNSRKSKDGKSSICKSCACKKSIEYYYADTEKARRHKLKNAYGITIEEYNEFSKEINHLCMICDSVCPSKRRLAVDHDHNNGIIRGLLCINCNKGLGNFKDNIDLLEKAIAYLESYKEALEEQKCHYQNHPARKHSSLI